MLLVVASLLVVPISLVILVGIPIGLILILAEGMSFTALIMSSEGLGTLVVFINAALVPFAWKLFFEENFKKSIILSLFQIISISIILSIMGFWDNYFELFGIEYETDSSSYIYTINGVVQ